MITPADIMAEVANYLPFVKRPAPRFISDSGNRIYGVVAEYADAGAVSRAAEQFRDAGYTRWDVYSPFPLHGIESHMGIKRTILPVMAFGAAIAGVLVALLMQFYMSDWDYQFIVQGKPTSAWEPFIPITFELGVLLTAFTCIGGMLMLNGLPRWNHPLFNSERFLKVSDDRLMIAVEAADANFDPDATRRLLEESGGTNIEFIEDDD